LIFSLGAAGDVCSRDDPFDESSDGLVVGPSAQQAGDLLVAPEGVPHGVRNIGDTRLLVLVVLAPMAPSGAA
jgi:oxalate decarboxylase/phosphoglucose isomerase-like protein (cupin superfamily)